MNNESNNQVNQKYAFVTGAGRGLGKGFVDYLSKNGYYVFAGVQTVKPEYKNSRNIEYVVCNVGNDQSIKDSVTYIRKKTTHIDLIINNAGINKDSATNNHKEIVCNLDKLQRKNLLEMFNINTISPLMITQSFLELMRNRETFIINISSCRASYHDEFENPTANYGYRASKAALNMMVYVSTQDLPKNVKTFTVHPGSVRSDMNPGGDQTPLEQAEKICSIITNWKSVYNGRFMRWDGSIYPL